MSPFDKKEGFLRGRKTKLGKRKTTCPIVYRKRGKIARGEIDVVRGWIRVPPDSGGTRFMIKGKNTGVRKKHAGAPCCMFSPNPVLSDISRFKHSVAGDLL